LETFDQTPKFGAVWSDSSEFVSFAQRFMNLIYSGGAFGLTALSHLPNLAKNKGVEQWKCLNETFIKKTVLEV